MVLGVSTAAIAASFVINLNTITDSFTSHVTNLFAGASYNERVETVTQARQLWEAHPWLGNGPGSFGPSVAADPLAFPDQGWKIVNNEYIELLAENGLIGLIAILVIAFIALIRTVKALLQPHIDPLLHGLLVACAAAFVGILVQYNTFSTLYLFHIWFVVGLLIALQNMILQPVSKDVI